MKKISGIMPTEARYHLTSKLKESISEIDSLGKKILLKAAGGIDYDERKRKIEK